MKDVEIKKIIIVLGPTASGKTELAIRLAEKIGGEIINADSMQIYSGMDIGTATPSPEQRERIPHHLLGIITPDRNFSAADFRREASNAIEDIFRRGSCPIVVGGTGLYIGALLKGLDESPSADREYREELKKLFERDGGEALLKMLAEVDMVTFDKLHPNDHVRIIRALEVYRQTGKPVSELRQEHGFNADHYKAFKIGIKVDRETLYKRIDCRVDQMIEDGFLEEVRHLLSVGYHPDIKAMKSIGYRQICRYIAGEYTWDEAVRLIKRDTRRYAKRQETWFNADKEISWVDYPESFASIVEHAIAYLTKGDCYGESTIQYSGSVSQPIPKGEGQDRC